LSRYVEHTQSVLAIKDGKTATPNESGVATWHVKGLAAQVNVCGKTGDEGFAISLTALIERRKSSAWRELRSVKHDIGELKPQPQVDNGQRGQQEDRQRGAQDFR
jgi:hypothetical protein